MILPFYTSAGNPRRAPTLFPDEDLQKPDLEKNQAIQIENRSYLSWQWKLCPKLQACHSFPFKRLEYFINKRIYWNSKWKGLKNMTRKKWQVKKGKGRSSRICYGYFGVTSVCDCIWKSRSMCTHKHNLLMSLNILMVFTAIDYEIGRTQLVFLHMVLDFVL